MNKDLAVRATSAIIFILCTFGIYKLRGTDGLSILGLVIVVIGVFEYSKMFFANDLKVRSLFLTISVLSLPVFFSLVSPKIIFLSLILFSLGTFVIYRKSEDVHQIHRTISLLFTGYFYTVVFPLFLFNILSIQELGLKLFISTLIITFSCDIFAYVFGRAFGKKLILPSVSPKKTFAGALGGLTASTISSFLLLTHFFDITTPIYSIIIGLACGIATQTGDFFASSLKRISGVKDSGKIMPGHGGVLDRFDGLYFSGPVFYIIFELFNISMH